MQVRYGVGHTRDTQRIQEVHGLLVHLLCDLVEQDLATIETRVDAYGDEDVTKTAAGMRTVAAAYGYCSGGLPPEQWGADHLVESVPDLLGFIR